MRQPPLTVLLLALAAAAVPAPDPARADSGPLSLITSFKGNPALSDADVVRDELDGGSWHPTQNWLAVSDNSTTTRLFDLSNPASPTVVRSFQHDPAFNYGNPATRVQVSNGEVNPVSFTPDGNWLATGINAQGVKVWNVQTGAVMQQLDNGVNIDGAAFSNDGRFLAVGANSLLKVYRFDQATGLADATPVFTYNFGSGEVNSIDWSADSGRLVAVGGVGSGIIGVFDAAGSSFGLRTPTYVNPGPGNVSVKSVKFSPDGELVLWGARQKRARVTDLDGNLVKDLRHQSSHTYYPYDDDDADAANEDVGWTSDGKYALTGGLTDGIVRVWRRRDWSLVGWHRAQHPGPDALSSPPRGRAVEAIDVDASNRVFVSGDEGRAYVYQFNAPVEKGAYTLAPGSPGGTPLSIEVEDYDTNLGQGFVPGTLNEQAWEPITSGTALAGASGGGLTVADAGVTRDTNYQSYDPTRDAPKLDYIVDFAEAGRYYVWVRGMGPDNGNSVHVGLDGETRSQGYKLQFGDNGTGEWTWVGAHGNASPGRAYLDIATPGEHTINLWMREDGVMIDKLVLTTDAGYVPTGLGPSATGRAPIPEPASAVVAVAAAGMLLPRRPRRATALPRLGPPAA